MRKILELKKNLRGKGIGSKVDIDASWIVLVEKVAVLNLQTCVEYKVTFWMNLGDSFGNVDLPGVWEVEHFHFKGANDFSHLVFHFDHLVDEYLILHDMFYP